MTTSAGLHAWFMEYPYEPPRPMYSDTLLAFKAFELSSTWAVRVEPDPLGPVNRIVTLMQGRRRVRSVLCPVPAGATVRLVRDESSWTLENLIEFRNQLWDSRGSGEPPPRIDVRPPGWRVEINDRTVLSVPDEFTPYVAPPVPPWRRLRYWATKRARSAADGAAGRLGYHRASECGGDW